jgi:osmotically-inducible protein OsmY
MDVGKSLQRVPLATDSVQMASLLVLIRQSINLYQCEEIAMPHEYDSPRGFANDGSRYDRPRRFEDRGPSHRPSDAERERHMGIGGGREYGREAGRNMNERNWNEQGRDAYGRGASGNRVQGGNQGWYGGQEPQGPYQRRELSNQERQDTRQDVRFGGRSNSGSSKYGGSDYASNDYQRNESQFGGPYEEQSVRQQLDADEYWNASRNDDDSGERNSQVIGDAWNRTRGDSEWNSPSQAISGSAAGFQSSGLQSSGFQSGQRQGLNYRGKGPKGYARSDDRIKEIVCEALTDAPHIDASDISIEVKNCEVTLTGTVVDRSTKYAVEDLIEHYAGVSEIHNQLKVGSAASAGTDAQKSGQRTAQNQGQTVGQPQEQTGSAGQQAASKSKSESDGGTGNRAAGDRTTGDKGSDKSSKHN